MIDGPRGVAEVEYAPNERLRVITVLAEVCRVQLDDQVLDTLLAEHPIEPAQRLRLEPFDVHLQQRDLIDARGGERGVERIRVDDKRRGGVGARGHDARQSEVAVVLRETRKRELT